MEPGRQAFTDYVLETRSLKRLCEHIPSAKLEEQGAHLRVHARRDDGKYRRPATAVTLPPDGCHRSPTGFEDAMHFLHCLGRVWHIHQAERAQGDIEHMAGKPEVFGLHTVKGDLVEA